RVVGDERLHQQDIDQVLESLVPLAGPRWQCHSVKFLRDVHAQRETSQLGRPRDPGCLLEWYRRNQLYLTLSGFGASNVDDDARPRTALVGDRKLDTHCAVLENEGLALSAKVEALIAAGICADGMFESTREVRLIM